MSFDDICRSLVLPSEAKIADRSDRVALHMPLLRNCLVRGDRAAPHTSFLRGAHTTIARPCHCMHSRLHHSFGLTPLFFFCDSTDQSKVFQCPASVRVLHSCVVNMSSIARRSLEAADVQMHMQSSGAVPELDEYDETWGADDVDDSDPKLAVDLATQEFLDYLLDLCQRRLRSVWLCIESWDVRRCGTQWVPP